MCFLTRFAPALVLLQLLSGLPAKADQGEVPQKMQTATVFGDDPCPPAPEGEIVVCGRLPESERYRIPKKLRKKPRQESGPSASWASKVRSLEDAQRFTMPGSCTAVGASGQTGCTQAMLRQWFLERKAMQEAQETP